MLLQQAEEAPRRKRKLSPEPETTKPSPLPTTKRRKREQAQFQGPPPAFWDNLSRLWLTPRALREFDRRARQRDSHQQRNPGNLKSVGAPSLKRFARHGGPDLSHIRAVIRADSQYMTASADRISIRNLKRARPLNQ